jgi:mono/diheme cytochrome c family protein
MSSTAPFSTVHSPRLFTGGSRLARWSAGSFCALALSISAHSAVTAQNTFEVFPAEVNLKTIRDRQSLVVRFTEAGGVHRDVTAEATFTLADSAKAKVAAGVVTPLADGETKLKVAWQGHAFEVPVKVEEAQADPEISFRRDVMPVFLKGDCNRCHGAARGQDGFRLSLFGYDPEGDHFRLTRELAGRRINLALPDESMLITKATGAAPHTGGKLFEKDSELAKTLIRWLEAGAPNDAADVPTCTSVEILPKQLVLEGPAQKFKLTVRARYSDGSDRDITGLAVFLTNNESSAKIDANGLITTGQRGEAFVMARFATHTVGAQVVVVPKGLKYEAPKLVQRNFIDAHVDAKLQNLRITPSEVCNDETFLRRVYIDTTGQLPSTEEVAKFVADPDAEKRSRKIEELLGRKEFVDQWALKWSELLQIRTDDLNQGSYKATLNYYTWLRDQLEKNVPINQIARQLIGASGSNFENPAANYYQLEQDPLKLAEDTAQAFFGIRVQCAQCHNHPFDRWTMDDYRGFVAFFTQVGRKNGEDPRERIIFNRGDGESKHPVGDRVVAPKFLGGEAPDTKGKDRREVLADWIAAPENPYFPRHIANLIWAQYLGRGIVEPVDDVRISNPASNPELLEALASRSWSTTTICAASCGTSATRARIS